MTDFDKTLRAARRLTRDGALAADTAVSGMEMVKAAGDVITARLDILAAGLADPSKADLVEMSLMSSEKIEALSRSAAAMGRTLSDIGGRMSANAVAEAGLASQAAAAMVGASSPAVAIQAQYAYAVGWWGRAASQMLTLNSALLKGQADAMRPIASTALANARRLKS